MTETETNAQEQKQKTCGLAIVSLILGILSLVLVCILFFLGLPAVICGHLALSRIKRQDNCLKGRGMAIAGLSTGYIAIAITIVMCLIGFVGGFMGAFKEAYNNSTNKTFFEKVENEFSEYVSIIPSSTNNYRKVFKTSFGKFSIEVPNDWQYKHNVLYVTFSPPNAKMNQSPLSVFPDDTQTFEYLMVSWMKNRKQKTLDKLYDNLTNGTRFYNKTYETSSRQDIQIDRIRAVSFNDKLVEDDVKTFGLVYLVPYKNLVYTLAFRADSVTFKSNKQMYEQIAYTFKPQSEK
jgi:flagellar basal body-associated protein FliL